MGAFHDVGRVRLADDVRQLQLADDVGSAPARKPLDLRLTQPLPEDDALAVLRAVPQPTKIGFLRKADVVRPLLEVDVSFSAAAPPRSRFSEA